MLTTPVTKPDGTELQVTKIGYLDWLTLLYLCLSKSEQYFFKGIK